MKKRIILGLLILIALGSVLSAQEAAAQKKMAAGMDMAPLFKGLIFTDTDADRGMFALSVSFEYLFLEHFSARAVMDTWFGESDNDWDGKDHPAFYFALVPEARWYPLSTGLDKLFLGAGIGFNLLSYDGDVDGKDGGFLGLTVNIKAGYKLILGPGVFVEPSIAYVYSKTNFMGVTPYGWQPGLSVGFAF